MCAAVIVIRLPALNPLISGDHDPGSSTDGFRPDKLKPPAHASCHDGQARQYC